MNRKLATTAAAVLLALSATGCARFVGAGLGLVDGTTDGVGQVVGGVISGFVKASGGTIEGATKIVAGSLEGGKRIVTGVGKAVEAFTSEATGGGSSVFEGVLSGAGEILGGGVEGFSIVIRAAGEGAVTPARRTSQGWNQDVRKRDRPESEAGSRSGETTPPARKWWQRPPADTPPPSAKRNSAEM
ncbi:MAG: hypothetical protein N3D11_02620 [Candidatus Sumerlaeia bacterium]|nr:hypothetical protein [Candidatus Sumerlaeia bacterium]